MKTLKKLVTQQEVPLPVLWTALLLLGACLAFLLRIPAGERSPWFAAVIVAAAGLAVAALFAGRRHLPTQGAVIFLAALLSYWPLELSGRSVNGGDSLWHVPAAMSLLLEGNFELSEYKEDVGRLPPWIVWINNMDEDKRLRRTDKGYHQGFPLGNTLACIPAAFAGNMIYGNNPSPMARSLRTTYIAARIFAALAVSLLYVLLRLTGAGTAVAAAATLLFAWATPHASLHGAGLWSHNILLPFLLAGLILLVWRKGSMAWLSALPFSFMFHVRPESAAMIIAATAYVFLRHRKQFLSFCLIGAGSLLIYLASTHAVFGGLSGGYVSVGRVAAQGNFLEALAGHFLTPNRGMLVFCPLFAFSLAGIAAWWRRRASMHPVYLLAALMIAAHLIVISRYPGWTGGFCYGPRMPAAIYPLLVIFLVPAQEAARGLRRGARAAVVLSVAAAIAWSVFVQVRGVTDWDVHHWNYEFKPYGRENIWRWDNFQILYGFGEDIAEEPQLPHWVLDSSRP